jgi:hypothetical protein
MTDAVEFALADGTSIAVSSSAARAGSGSVGLGGRVQAADKTLRQALAPVTAAAAEMLGDFRRLADPDEVEISFGVALDAKLGGVIVNASAGAHLDVTLRWRTDAPAAEPAPAPPQPQSQPEQQESEAPEAS